MNADEVLEGKRLKDEKLDDYRQASRDVDYCSVKWRKRLIPALIASGLIAIASVITAMQGPGNLPIITAILQSISVVIPAAFALIEAATMRRRQRVADTLHAELVELFVKYPEPSGRFVE